MCNQSVGLIARILEEQGIPTVTLNMFPEVADYVIPPRTLQTKFVFGAPIGDPGNRELHRKVLESCLTLLEKAETPGQVEELPYKWKHKL